MVETFVFEHGFERVGLAVVAADEGQDTDRVGAQALVKRAQGESHVEVARLPVRRGLLAQEQPVEAVAAAPSEAAEVAPLAL